MSKSASYWFEKAIENIRSENYQKALECLNKVIEIDPKYEGAWFQLGWSYSHLWKVDESIECYKKAVNLEPENYEAWYNLGKQYQDEQEAHKKAIECYEKVVKISPEFSYAWNNMGLAYDNLNDPQKAAECYEKAVKFDPQNQRAWVNFAINQYFMKSYLKSLECYEKAMEIEALPGDARMSLQAALESMKIKVELNAQNKKIWTKMASNYLKLGLFKKTIECAKKIVEFDVQEYDAWHALGLAYHGLNDHEQFLDCFEKRDEIFKDLKKVSIITTDQGPLYPDVFWLIESSSKIGIIPSEDQDSNFLLEVQGLPDFNNGEVIKAMLSTEDNIFVCWEKKN